MTLAPIHMTFASLLKIERSVENGSWQTAARIPGTLLAVIAIPIPVPHTRIPRSQVPSVTFLQVLTATSGYNSTSPSPTPLSMTSCPAS